MRQFKMLAFDLMLIAAATVAATALRDNLVITWLTLTSQLPYLFITLACAAVILPSFGINRTMWRFSGLSDYRRLVLSCAGIVMLSVLIGFATLRMENVPRSLPILQGIIMILTMVAVRVVMRSRRNRHGGHEHLVPPSVEQEAVIIVGLTTIAELFIQAVAENPSSKIAIAGVIGRSERHTGHLFRGQPILGTPEEIPQILKDLDVHGVTVDRIVVATGIDKLSQSARDALNAVEDGTQIKIDYFAERLGFAALPVQAVATETGRSATSTGLPNRQSRDSIEYRELLASLSSPYWRTKRWLDVGLSAIAILALAPIMVVIGIANGLVHGLPVMFWQQRPGLNGRPFRVFMFRSLLGAHDEMGQRLPDEQRETWFGRFLRATHLDELPQLLNIFMGHMSFVGPRPLLVTDQLEQFNGRLLVRPGLTGWAQVNGGKSVAASDKMALDFWYIRNASFALDAKIVIYTIYMLLHGERENQEAVDQAWLELQRKRNMPAAE